MRNVTLVGATFLACVLVLLGTGCSKLKSRDDLNKGVTAYRNAKYNDAVGLFQEAADLDPTNPNARTYLAIAYMMQCGFRARRRRKICSSPQGARGVQEGSGPESE